MSRFLFSWYNSRITYLNLSLYIIERCPLFREAQFNNSNGVVLRPENLYTYVIEKHWWFHGFNVLPTY